MKRTARIKRRLLIVEPDRLTRWSMEEYLREVYDIHTCDSPELARHYLGEVSIDAMILSDDLPGDASEKHWPDHLEHVARSRNPGLIVVRMGTHPSSKADTAAGSLWLEKPFELDALAAKLGIPPHLA